MLITTSYLARQAYQEIREDGHPVAVVAAVDIAAALKKRGLSTPAEVVEVTRSAVAQESGESHEAAWWESRFGRDRESKVLAIGSEMRIEGDAGVHIGGRQPAIEDLVDVVIFRSLALEAGRPCYYIDRLVNGDTATVTTLDGREFTYRTVRRDITDAQNTNILNATRFHPGTTLSLVACTVGYDSRKSRHPDAWAPASLLYRIVVTFELVS